MITVRFPNGQAITYNNAMWIIHYESSGGIMHDLWTKKGGEFIARIPPGCIVEWIRPCKVENSAQVQTLESAARLVAENLRKIPKSLAAEIKAALEKFNRQTYRWKP